MGWKFWSKKSTAGDSVAAEPKKNKLPGPKDLPQAVGRHLVVNLKNDPDWVWSLQSVTRPKDDSKTRRLVRVFNPETAGQSRVTVRNYDTLTEHPDLVLFEGWYDKSSGAVELQGK